MIGEAEQRALLSFQKFELLDVVMPVTYGMAAY
jgi:hypothetical protein